MKVGGDYKLGDGAVTMYKVGTQDGKIFSMLLLRKWVRVLHYFEMMEIGLRSSHRRTRI